MPNIRLHRLHDLNRTTDKSQLPKRGTIHDHRNRERQGMSRGKSQVPGAVVTAPFTPEELQERRGFHYLDDESLAFGSGECRGCQMLWPCDASQAFATIDDRDQEIARHHKDFARWEEMADKGAKQLAKAQAWDASLAEISSQREHLRGADDEASEEPTYDQGLAAALMIMSRHLDDAQDRASARNTKLSEQVRGTTWEN